MRGVNTGGLTNEGSGAAVAGGDFDMMRFLPSWAGGFVAA